MIDGKKVIEIKLDILQSLARSQKALTRIVESVAHAIESSPQISKHLAENLQSISKYQRILASKLTGIEVKTRAVQTPGKVWLANKLRKKGDRR